MIKLICVGKIKEKYFQDAIEEYKKRLKKYVNFEIIEVLDTKTDDYKVAIKKEKEQIERYISEKDYVVSLAIEGKELTSIEFAKFIDNAQLTYSNITFIIGGSCGLAEELKFRSNKLISFSKQTFPHQLFRVMFLEQLYRTYKINNNETYHK
ncbi:MAG: 23S rRNA (pseudouridine(1915)-N(3))-methyltransferase RlmH [Bacilli bacterium]